MLTLRREIRRHRRSLRTVADVAIVVASLTVAAIAYVRYDAKHQPPQTLPGRAGETWTSPDGRAKIVERIIDDGGATVGFYRNLYVERDGEFEQICFFRIEPRPTVVARCDWRGGAACVLTIDPQAYYAWLESPPDWGTFNGVEVSFRMPRRRPEVGRKTQSGP